MAYPLHDLFVMGGQIGSGADAEVWQCGVRGTFNVALTPATRMAWLNARKTQLNTWFATQAARMRSDATLTYIKCNPIGTNGKYADPQASYQVTASSTGGIAPSLPDFVTLAWSWKTGVARGPGSNGRIYPPNALGTYSNGATRVSSAEADAQVAAAKAFLTILNTADSGAPYFAPSVISGVGAGSQAFITRIRVGNVLDVQRRRKNKLREAYSSLSFP